MWSCTDWRKQKHAEKNRPNCYFTITSRRSVLPSCKRNVHYIFNKSPPLRTVPCIPFLSSHPPPALNLFEIVITNVNTVSLMVVVVVVVVVRLFATSLP